MFDAREHVHELPDFEFTGIDGETYRLPNIGTLIGEQLMELDADNVSLIKDLDADAYQAIMQMPRATMQRLFVAWMAHGDEAGKEAPKRSKSTSTPSKQTRSRKASTPAA